MRQLRAVAILLAVAIGATGCSLFKKGGTGPESGESTLTYGSAPLRDRSVTYQPDVVFVEGGANAIRSASSDGLTWTVAADARGASDVAVGKVMYATSRAVGRVVAVRPNGRDIAVTLAPVTLTEVFRDARFSIDRDIQTADVVYQEIPGLPGAVTEPAAQRSAPKMMLAPLAKGFSSTLDDALPPAKKSSTIIAIGDWEAQPYRETTKIGLKVGYKKNKNLKVFVDFSMKAKKLRVRSNLLISNSVIDGASTLALDGIESIAIDLATGAAEGAESNGKVRVEVPVEINIPVPGEPLMIRQSWKFIVITALGGKNSTVTAAGEWGIDGAIGIVNGALMAPTVTVIRSIMDTIGGLAIGTSGMVFAAELKVQFGIGIPVAFAGPYAKLVTDLGVTLGSALGAPLAKCVSGTLDVKVGGGFGLSVSSEAIAALEKLLPATVKLTREVESTTPIFHGSQTLPDVPLCGGG